MVKEGCSGVSEGSAGDNRNNASPYRSHLHREVIGFEGKSVYRKHDDRPVAAW